MEIEETTDRVFRVRRRLDFVQTLSTVRAAHNLFELKFDLPHGGWSHPLADFDALRTYLLLTCFDLLGQSNDFCPYDEWLKSEKKKDERDAAFALAEQEADFLAKLKIVHAEYLRIHGVGNAFRRFIGHNLSLTQRQILLDSIRVSLSPIGPPNVSMPALPHTESDEGKISFLLRLRNGYTHHANVAGSINDDTRPGFGLIPPAVLADLDRDYFVPIEWQKFEGDKRKQYFVKKWPQVLVDCVELAISSIETREL